MRGHIIHSIGLVLLMLGSVAQSADVRWTGSGGDNLWDNPANWDVGRVPTSGDEVYVDVPAALSPNGPVIQEGMEAEVSGLLCEKAGEPTMTMTGGTLDVGAWIWWGDGADSHGTLYLSGGTITTGSEFELGWGGGEGTIFMTGGTINAKELVVPTGSARAGQLYLHGGVVNVGSDGLEMTDTGLIDIGEGTLTLEDDQRELIDEFIGSGLITAYGGAGLFEIDYDQRNVGMTTVTAVSPVTEKAYGPDAPADGEAEVYRDAALVWVPGIYADKHDIYLGTVFEDVNNATRANPLGVLVSQGQDAKEYDPVGHLELGQTYYWRIDEVNGAPDYTIFKGNVWSFSTEAFVYPVKNIIATSNTTSEPDAGPEKSIDGSGLNASDEHSAEAFDMWLGSPDGDESAWIQYEFDRVYQLHEMHVWNYNVSFELILGFGLKDVTITYSVDGAEWMVLDDVEFARGLAQSSYACNTTVALGGVAARYVRFNIGSRWGTMAESQYGLSEVRFLYIPAHARAPMPASGEGGVYPPVVLAWRAGREAAAHEVYFSGDSQAVLDGAALIDTVEENRYDLGSLDLQLGETYYWKVNEVNEAEAVASWEGDLWDFEISEFLVADDFESYTNDEGSRIYESWTDGWDTDDNGSLVGYDSAPFAERMVVHSGKQSMPFFYNNTGGMTHSEAERVFAPAQDWTRAGAKTLRLYFYGDPGNVPGQMYVKINGARADYDGDAQMMADPSWTLWVVDLSSVGVDLEHIASLSLGVDGAGSGVLLLDDIRLYGQASE